VAAPLRVGVLLSGSGTNLQAILDAAGDAYAVVVVVSDKADAFGLDRARSAGVAAVHVDPTSFDGREAFNAGLVEVLHQHRVDLVCLAGFMRILAPNFVRVFSNRILNIHPALLPAFPGGHAVSDALAWGVKVTGTTVHLVDEEVDHGPVVLQRAVAVEPGDTEETLHERIKAAEHELYPEAIKLFAAGRLKIEGRVVHVLD
jgi:phosphoribosylglycinamide formyltransferase 1